jgi:hypothetical protein
MYHKRVLIFKSPAAYPFFIDRGILRIYPEARKKWTEKKYWVEALSEVTDYGQEA